MVKASSESGLDGVIGHVMIPGMIEEDDGRPVEMKPKLDVLDFWSLIKPELPGVTSSRPWRAPNRSSAAN